MQDAGLLAELGTAPDHAYDMEQPDDKHSFAKYVWTIRGDIPVLNHFYVSPIGVTSPNAVQSVCYVKVPDVLTVCMLLLHLPQQHRGHGQFDARDTVRKRHV